MEQPNCEDTYSFLSLSETPQPTPAVPEFDLSDVSPITPLQLPSETSSMDPSEPARHCRLISGSDDSPVAQPDSSLAPEGEKRRGRKRQYVTEEQRKFAYSKKVERNRYYAKENRRRKKEYVQTLEGKISELTMELDACKKRLAEYEAKDSQRYASIVEFGRGMKADTLRFAEQRILQVASIVRSSAHDIVQVIPVLKTSLEDKNKILDMMAGATLDFSVPEPYRCMIHLSESECGWRGQAESRGDPMVEQVRQLWEHILAEAPEARAFFQAAAGTLRDNIDKYLGSLENIKKQMTELNFYLIERLTPRLKEECLDGVLRWVQESARTPRIAPLRFCGEKLAAVAVIKLSPERSCDDSGTDQALPGIRPGN